VVDSSYGVHPSKILHRIFFLFDEKIFSTGTPRIPYRAKN
jgi:hypothetical protein